MFFRETKRLVIRNFNIEDSDGNPIEFQAAEYALTSNEWKAVNNQ